MNTKKIIEKLKRARNSLMKDPALSSEDRELLMSLNLEIDAENNIHHIKKIVNRKKYSHAYLDDDQRLKLKIIEKTGTGSQKIH